MKTKIIYISGSEVFEMADVRAAFDEVRTALGLGRDTVLFGVPVDNDDALAPSMETTQAAEIIATAPIIEEAPAEIIEEISSPIIQEITEPEIEEQIQTETVIEEAAIADKIDPIVEEMPAPVKKSRGRPRKAVAVADAPQETEPTQSDKVIPILSVLAANNVHPTSDTDVTPTDIVEDEIEEVLGEEIEETPVDEIEEIIVSEVDEGDDNDSLDTDIDIDDMIADQAPEEPIEKTLEQLLESMTPLREDHGDAQVAHMDEAPVTISESAEIIMSDDADATLEQLASEFADTADKIAAPAPGATQGKIGKLKNILPFKKARRDDTGLMGDLFGWAGVAANDEDFSIPGFFTTAAKK